MDLYLPVAEMSVNVGWILLLGAAVGFLSGLFGVGGGFLLTPLLTFMGLPPTIAVGTQACQLAGTSLSGVAAQARKRNIDIQMGFILTIGSFAGTGAGVWLFRWLKQVGQINLVILLGYVSLLGIVGFLMLWESAPRLWRRSRERGGAMPRGTADLGPTALYEGWGAGTKLAIVFSRSRLKVSVLLPLALGFFGGLLVAILGVGGGFVLVPAMIYILRMPPALVNGTSLFQIMFTTAFATLLQAVANHSVDALLALLLLVGSVVAVPAGTALAWRLRPEVARFLMACLVLAVLGKLVFDLLMTPEMLYAVEMKVLP